MPADVFVAGETLSAHAALVRPRWQVDAAVSVEVRLALERHAAVVALVRLLDGVLFGHVLLERQRLVKVQAADPAHELVWKLLQRHRPMDYRPCSAQL